MQAAAPQLGRLAAGLILGAILMAGCERDPGISDRDEPRVSVREGAPVETAPDMVTRRAAVASRPTVGVTKAASVVEDIRRTR